jgi:hypothetical protein
MLGGAVRARLRVGWEWVSTRDGEMESEMERRRMMLHASKNNAYAQAFNSSAAIAGGMCTGEMYLM